MQSAPTILYIGYWPRELRRRRFDGICRYAKSRGCEVMPILSDDVPDVSALRAALKRFRPVGVVTECTGNTPPFPPSAFGRVPVVYFDPPEKAPWRTARSVVCDEAAVARAAFRELAAPVPPAFAIVSYMAPQSAHWAVERESAFRALCAASGKPCAVFAVRRGESPEELTARLVPWVAALPNRCAVFAIDDYRAVEAMDAFSAARRPLPHTATLVGANGAGAPGGDERYSISTVKIDFELSGYLAAKALFESRAGELPHYGPLLVDRRRTTGGSGRREARVMDAVETIRREACDGLTAAALAARQSGSRRNFDRRFREAVGHSVLDEILHVRLERVLAMLSGTDTPVGVISDMCGFGSEDELRHLFKARFGVSMTEWRALRR